MSDLVLVAPAVFAQRPAGVVGRALAKNRRRQTTTSGPSSVVCRGDGGSGRSQRAPGEWGTLVPSPNWLAALPARGSTAMAVPRTDVQAMPRGTCASVLVRDDPASALALRTVCVRRRATCSYSQARNASSSTPSSRALRSSRVGGYGHDRRCGSPRTPTPTTPAPRPGCYAIFPINLVGFQHVSDG
jgi:hypothetical protein